MISLLFQIWSQISNRRLPSSVFPPFLVILFVYFSCFLFFFFLINKEVWMFEFWVAFCFDRVKKLNGYWNHFFFPKKFTFMFFLEVGFSPPCKWNSVTFWFIFVVIVIIIIFFCEFWYWSFVFLFCGSADKQILKIGSAKAIAAPHGWPDAAKQCCSDGALRSRRRRRVLAQCRSCRRCRWCRYGAVVAVCWIATSGLSLGFYWHRPTPSSQSSHAGKERSAFSFHVYIHFLSSWISKC